MGPETSTAKVKRDTNIHITGVCVCGGGGIPHLRYATPHAKTEAKYAARSLKRVCFQLRTAAFVHICQLHRDVGIGIQAATMRQRRHFRLHAREEAKSPVEAMK